MVTIDYRDIVIQDQADENLMLRERVADLTEANRQKTLLIADTAHEAVILRQMYMDIRRDFQALQKAYDEWTAKLDAMRKVAQAERDEALNALARLYVPDQAA